MKWMKSVRLLSLKMFPVSFLIIFFLLMICNVVVASRRQCVFGFVCRIVVCMSIKWNDKRRTLLCVRRNVIMLWRWDRMHQFNYYYSLKTSADIYVSISKDQSHKQTRKNQNVIFIDDHLWRWRRFAPKTKLINVQCNEMNCLLCRRTK